MPYIANSVRTVAPLLMAKPEFAESGRTVKGRSTHWCMIALSLRMSIPSRKNRCITFFRVPIPILLPLSVATSGAAIVKTPTFPKCQEIIPAIFPAAP
jgi:hypothetical protein